MHASPSTPLLLEFILTIQSGKINFEISNYKFILSFLFNLLAHFQAGT